MKIICPICLTCEIDIRCFEGIISGHCQTCELRDTRVDLPAFPEIWFALK
jgi:hypothetical protein